MRLPVVLRALVVVVGGLVVGLLAFHVAGDGLATVAEAAVAGMTGDTTISSVPASPPSPTPTTAPSEPAEVGRGRLLIHAVGDVNTDTDYIPALAEHGHQHAWSGLDGLFQDDDLTIVNLECAPSTRGRPLDKEFVFRCDLDSLPAMRQAGVDVASLANNHSGDFGQEALLDGRSNLEAAGLVPVGVGYDRYQAASPAVVVRNGWRIGVVGLGGVVPGPAWIAGEDRAGMADGDDIDSMVEAVRAATTVADFVVVTIHWGVEGDLEPTADDRERAAAMIEAGADAIFGHHPHRLQPLELVEGVPVAWSLGNFVWPSLSEAGSTTAVAQVAVEPDGTLTACLLPAYIVSSGRPELVGEPDCLESAG